MTLRHTVLPRINRPLFLLLGCLIALTLVLSGCSDAPDSVVEESPSFNEDTHALVLLSRLPGMSDRDTIGIVELDPDSDRFGQLVYEYELPVFDAPLHHLYYSPAGRLYATGLGTQCSLAEIKLNRNLMGMPQVLGVDCIDTFGQVVGEDIMWHEVKGEEYMFVTFMGGMDITQPDGGSVGVFDPQTNQLLTIIEARKSEVKEGQPYIMYPHGISAYGDRMVVTSTVHPDLKTGVGNTITIIDLNSFEAIENIVTEDSKPVGFPSSPVEVLFVRPSIVENVEPAILVNTMFGFETWKIPYNESDKSFGSPEKLYDGATAGTGVPLEFYGNETELFISHAIPGVIKRYHLDKLPDLVSSGEDIKTELGAHHMIFFTDSSGRDLIAVQNNLLNLGNAADNDPSDVDFIAKVNDHSITVHDLATGERLGTVNFKQQYKRGIDNIEALFRPGFVHHH